MNTGTGPDLLGVCEVENRYVLDLLVTQLARLLPARKYRIVHADTDDARGIDVAFFFDPKHFTAPKKEVFFHVVMRRNATREILQVNFQTAKGRTWSVFANHWPSRSGGQAESAGYRHIAGETLAYFHARALEVHGPDTPALAMGDFNDEPFDLSLVSHALSTRQRRQVVEADIARFWNLTWPALGRADGTFHFESEPYVFDQFLVNKNMARDDSKIARSGQHRRGPPLPGNVHEGPLPVSAGLRRHGQQGSRRRLLRPLPHRHPSRGSRLTRTRPSCA
jgi:hypothetical protein